MLWGIEDRVNRASGGRSLQRRMPNCDLYLFSRTGHWVQWERAAEFNAVVAAFLARHRLMRRHAMNTPTDIAQASSLFGRISLGYLLVESRNWPTGSGSPRDGLGMQVDAHRRRRGRAAHRRAPAPPHRSQRPDRRRGALGWQLHDEDALQLALERLRGADRSARGRGAEAALRGVERFWAFVGPKRLRFELFTRPLLDRPPLRHAGQRLRHRRQGPWPLRDDHARARGDAALLPDRSSTRGCPTPSRTAQRRDARADLPAPERAPSLGRHCGHARHAHGSAAHPIHHLNLQATTLDDVTEAYRRCAAGLRIAIAIGQHPNDRDLSFYAVSPSGFEFELGWNPIVVTEEDERVAAGPLSGHQPVGALPREPDAGRQARPDGPRPGSLTRKEYTVERRHECARSKLRRGHRRPWPHRPDAGARLGQRGHRVLVLEREPKFYGNARAVYTDGECTPRRARRRALRVALGVDRLHRQAAALIEERDVARQAARRAHQIGFGADERHARLGTVGDEPRAESARRGSPPPRRRRRRAADRLSNAAVSALASSPAKVTAA